MKLAAININFDSLGEMYNYPENYSDVSYTKIADRFIEFSKQYGFKYSIYVIGKDLQIKENIDLVKKWHDAGHEIGSHSWSHPLNLGSMSDAQIREEVGKSHEIISTTTGKEPKGFIAPGWSSSHRLFEVLMEFGYEYDTSVFPSWLLYPSLLKMLLLQLGTSRFKTILKREDFFNPITKSDKPYFIKSQKSQARILQLPLPTGYARLACWHTLVFMLGKKVHFSNLRHALKKHNHFYYLTHPADLLDPSDLEPAFQIRLERASQSLAVKNSAFEEALKIIIQQDFSFVTMKEISDTHWKQSKS